MNILEVSFLTEIKKRRWWNWIVDSIDVTSHQYNGAADTIYSEIMVVIVNQEWKQKDNVCMLQREYGKREVTPQKFMSRMVERSIGLCEGFSNWRSLRIQYRLYENAWNVLNRLFLSHNDFSSLVSASQYYFLNRLKCKI